MDNHNQSRVLAFHMAKEISEAELQAISGAESKFTTLLPSFNPTGSESFPTPDLTRD